MAYPNPKSVPAIQSANPRLAGAAVGYPPIDTLEGGIQMRVVRSGAVPLGVLAVLALMAACSQPGPGRAAPGSAGPAGAGAASGRTATGDPAPVVANGHGWSASGLDGPVPAPGTCRSRTTAEGQPLPDPACTPGAIDAAVTDANTATTVCRKGGYTGSVRPPEALTEPVKRRLLAAYGIPAAQIGDYELDHLIPLSVGGASDVRNLWPERNEFLWYRAGGEVHNDKDVVEDHLFRALCEGRTTVAAAERAMATNWTTAVAVLGLPPIPRAGSR